MGLFDTAARIGSFGLYNPGRDRASRNLMSELGGMERPTKPTWTSMMNEGTGRLQDKYQLRYESPDNKAMMKLREEALRSPDQMSAWAKLAAEKQALEEQTLRGRAQQDMASRIAEARNNLATRGGLRGGAAERFAFGSARDLARSNQDVARQGVSNRLEIRGMDESNRQGALKNVAATESDYNKINQAQAINEANAKRLNDLEQYKADMAAYGAGKTAQSQMLGGKK